MVEYNKYCLRYRYFLFFKGIEKILLYMFDLVNIKYQKSNVLTPHLDKVIKCKFLSRIFLILKKITLIYLM